MSKKEAIKKAQRLADQQGRCYYVLDEYEECNRSRYQVTDIYELETFWAGLPEERIIHVAEPQGGEQ